jgi:hypothetical protein
MKNNDLITSNLETLAAEINTEHRAVFEAIKAGLQHALRCGQLLLQAKEQVKHCEVSERSAQAYMRIAQRWPELEKSATVADLTFRGALELLAVNPESDKNATSLTDFEKWRIANDEAKIAVREELDQLDKRLESCTTPEEAIKIAKDSEDLYNAITIYQLRLERKIGEYLNRPITKQDWVRLNWEERGRIPDHDPYPEEYDPDRYSPPVENKRLPLESIIRDDEFDARSYRDPSWTAWLASIFETLPPIGVYQIDGKYYLVDGFYRLDAAKLTGISEVDCRIYEGTKEDALLYSIAANARNGIALKDGDFQRFIRRPGIEAEIRRRRKNVIENGAIHAKP